MAKKKTNAKAKEKKSKLASPISPSLVPSPNAVSAETIKNVNKRIIKDLACDDFSDKETDIEEDNYAQDSIVADSLEIEEDGPGGDSAKPPTPLCNIEKSQENNHCAAPTLPERAADKASNANSYGGGPALKHKSSYREALAVISRIFVRLFWELWNFSRVSV